MKRIPETVFLKWHSTGTLNHVPSFINDEFLDTCKICKVTFIKNNLYGCQGMKFKDWLKKQNYKRKYHEY